MTCMIKAIYDTVLVVSGTRGQEMSQQEEPLQHTQLSMSIGPLIDLAFEIYADMRNVGPIRRLPQLSALAPTTSIPRSLKTPGTMTHVSQEPTVPSNGSTGSMSMSIFFQLPRGPSVSSSLPSVDLSACDGSATPSGATCATFQSLNPTLSPAFPGRRRLPKEVYLALLHLCVQVPLSGIQQSVQVVKTIIADIVSTRSGQQPADLDRHLAAAMQVFHDQWMCRPKELKGRDGGDNLDERSKEACSGIEGCLFHGWMYRPEVNTQEYMTSLNTCLGNVPPTDLCGTSTTMPPGSASATDLSSGITSPVSSNDESYTVMMGKNNDESPHYGVSVHDAELDEIDRYLGERAAAEALDKKDTCTHWIDGFDHDTCNDGLYWGVVMIRYSGESGFQDAGLGCCGDMLEAWKDVRDHRRIAISRCCSREESVYYEDGLHTECRRVEIK